MILVIAAMQDEIKEIAKSLKPQTHVVVTGVGKVNAAMKLTEIIHQERLEAIINVGFAGASGNFQVGDLVLVNKTRYHDFDLSMFGYEIGQVPGNPTYFKSSDQWVQIVKDKIPNLKTAELLTGDYFMSKKIDGDHLFDMEGASLYQVAHHYHIPILSVKVISDVVSMEKHIENYREFEAEKGANILKEVYDMIFGGK